MFINLQRACGRYYKTSTEYLERSCLLQLESLFKLMPYKMDLPRHPSARSHVIGELCLTCERRALALFKALIWLLPLPLLALYLTATLDATLVFLLMGRFLVGDTCKRLFFTWPHTTWPGKQISKSRATSLDGIDPPVSRNSSHESSKAVANCLALFGILIHIFQFIHFFNRKTLISSPYGFCSTIFVFLVTGFITHSLWCTVILCIVKSFSISMIYLTVQPALTETEIGYFYGYWCACAIVLTVITPVHLETIGRIIAEGQATTFKKHMNDLLRASFDACVWVDDQLVVMDTDPKLDAMFSLGMKNRSLLEFVKEPESMQFATNVKNSIVNHATSLHHVTFQSSDGPIDVDIYITSKLSYWSREDQHHLVGFRLRPEIADPIQEQPDAQTPPDSNSAWECPECHCVNFSRDSDNCILCGYRGAIDFGCRTIPENAVEDTWNYTTHHPQSEVSSVWDVGDHR